MKRIPHRETVYVFLLIVGFTTLSIGTLVAYLNPATGFELSIYDETPFLFWIGFSSSMIISIYLVFLTTNSTLRSIAVGLGGLSFTNFIMLPLIRSWYYISKRDGLTHLGRTRDINDGFLTLWEIKYPAIYGHNIAISNVVGFNFERSFLMVIGIFVLVFIVFVPLTVRLFTTDRWVVSIGIFSGFLLLPINPLAIRLEPFPSTQAIFYSIIIMYLIIFAFQYPRYQVTILLTLSLFTIVLLHPQQAANLLSLIIVFAAIQLLHSRISSDTTSYSWPVYSQAMVLGILFWIWANTNLRRLFEVGVTRAIGVIMGLRNDTPAESVQTRSTSLDLLGGSVEELFVKVFLVSVFYSLASGFLMGASILSHIDRCPKKIDDFFNRIFNLPSRSTIIIAYWSFGFVAPVILFIIYLAGGITDQYFRHFGFLMVTVTVFGALSLGHLLVYFRSSNNRRSSYIVTIVLILLLVTMSIPVVFESPYVYQHTHHHTETEMNGIKIALENTNSDYTHAALRTRMYRFEDAIYGLRATGTGVERGGPETLVPDRFADRRLRGEPGEHQYYRSLPGFFNETSYLFVREEDRMLETKVYRGLRWSEEDFRYLEQDQNINQIHDNDGVTLYIVYPREKNTTSS